MGEVLDGGFLLFSVNVEALGRRGGCTQSGSYRSYALFKINSVFLRQTSDAYDPDKASGQEVNAPSFIFPSKRVKGKPSKGVTVPKTLCTL